MASILLKRQREQARKVSKTSEQTAITDRTSKQTPTTVGGSRFGSDARKVYGANRPGSKGRITGGGRTT